MMDVKHIIFFVFYIFATCSCSEYIPISTACDSQIYCNGTLLHNIQMFKLFNDSKTFVDMKLKNLPNTTKEDFDKKMSDWNYKPTKDLLTEFVNEYFVKEDSEFEKWIPTDWIREPEVLNSIKDENLKKWTIEINALWLNLGRKIKDDVRLNPEHYSIIYVPNPFIIPGGRFREFYYWDSYWIINGLLICKMHITAKGMISNYISMIKTFGHVPNGGRIYYAKRSQPPMITPMVKSYVDATNDMTFVIENINILEIEFQYWITQHNVSIRKNGKNYTLAVYRDDSTGPRPESYREDINKAESLTTESEKENFYSELKATAESGWDFSSRWYIDNGTNKGDLKNTRTRSIVPVELNSIIYWNAKILSDFYRKINNTRKASIYEDISLQWQDAVTAILWDEEIGSWLDYDALNNMKRNFFYPTNLSPLWTGCFTKNNTVHLVTKVLKYLNETKILNYAGGIPTTVRETDQQWDFPIAWAPLQYIMVMALDNTGHRDAKILASKIASKWICNNYLVFKKTSLMYEKYLVNATGEKGPSIGEYSIQTGFGWTNGVILEFLQKYGFTASSKKWNITSSICSDD